MLVSVFFVCFWFLVGGLFFKGTCCFSSYQIQLEQHETWAPCTASETFWEPVPGVCHLFTRKRGVHVHPRRNNKKWKRTEVPSDGVQTLGKSTSFEMSVWWCRKLLYEGILTTFTETAAVSIPLFLEEVGRG